MNGQLVEWMPSQDETGVLGLLQDLRREVVALRREVVALRREVADLRRENADLRRENLELRQQAGYWKTQHARAVERMAQLEAEVEQLRGENRQLQARLFGQKSERSSCRDFTSRGRRESRCPFGQKSEHSSCRDRSNHLDGEHEDAASGPRKRGQRVGQPGPGRRDYNLMPVVEELLELPVEERTCAWCGATFAPSGTEDSEQLEIDVRAYRRRIRRRRYQRTCDCQTGSRTLVAPSPPKLIPKGCLGVSVWVELLLGKFFSHQPIERQLAEWRLLGLDVFCWAHVRRDFVEVGKGWDELKPWALAWLRRIRELYRHRRQRLAHDHDSAEFAAADAAVRQTIADMHAQAAAELADPHLRAPCRKTLTSLQAHWSGLTRFVDDLRIPLDNNASQRANRGPAVGRKNYYGSGSLWSGRLAAMLFSLFATLTRNNVNPRQWLTWYLESCAARGGRAPDEIALFLPWNFTAQRSPSLALDPHNTS
jgi:regulator of replication initiation timing